MWDQRMLVRASAVLLAGFVAIVVAQHALQPELSPRGHGISQYATGAPGWLMTVGFLSWAGALGALAVAGARSRLRPRAVVVALAILLGIAAACAAGTAVWRTGAAHGDASGLLELAVWAAAVLSFGVTDARLRAQSAVLLLGAFAAAALIDGDPGIRQRALIAAGCAWHAALLLAVRTAGTRERGDRARCEPGRRSSS